jgi:hypothetical protein
MSHRVYPPFHLSAEENGDNVSRLVFITSGIDDQKILDSLRRLALISSPFSQAVTSADGSARSIH